MNDLAAGLARAAAAKAAKSGCLNEISGRGPDVKRPITRTKLVGYVQELSYDYRTGHQHKGDDSEIPDESTIRQWVKLKIAHPSFIKLWKSCSRKSRR